MPKTKLRQKALLILLGLCITVVILEAMLRLGGFIFLSFQERLNRLSIDQNSEYRILCLGESTTALGGSDAYPRQMEKILNARQNKIKFAVINKGIPSITTSHIVANLNKYLDEYRPHMVTVMMGINDGAFYLAPAGNAASFFDQFRIYKLGKFIFLHLTHRIKEEKDRNLSTILEKLKEQVASSPSLGNYIKLSGLYRAAQKPEEERVFLLKAFALAANNPEVLYSLGNNYKLAGEYKNAIETYDKMVKVSADNQNHKIEAYANLAECYKLAGQLQRSEEVYREAIAYLPNHPGAYGCLADLYLEEKRYTEAAELLTKQIGINPRATLFYGKLAHCYLRNGRPDAAEQLLQQGIRINPDTASLYAELGYCLVEQKKYPQAQIAFEKALSLKSQSPQGVDINVKSYLLACYKAQGNKQQAEKLKQTLAAQKEAYNPLTARNYREIQETLITKKISLVAIQYPMRNIKPLKKMLESYQRILFVDNEQSFKSAIAKGNASDYFLDHFAGDFGHCTPKGNYLLAGNIADVILDYVLKNSKSQ